MMAQFSFFGEQFLYGCFLKNILQLLAQCKHMKAESTSVTSVKAAVNLNVYPPVISSFLEHHVVINSTAYSS